MDNEVELIELRRRMADEYDQRKRIRGAVKQAEKASKMLMVKLSALDKALADDMPKQHETVTAER